MGLFDLFKKEIVPINEDKHTERNDTVIKTQPRKCSFCGEIMLDTDPGHIAFGRIQCADCYSKGIKKEIEPFISKKQKCYACLKEIELHDTITLDNECFCKECYNIADSVEFKQNLSNAKNKLLECFSREIFEAVLKEFETYCRIEYLYITTETDFGRREVIARAKNLDELLFEVLNQLCDKGSWKYELKHRAENASNWRYLRNGVKNDRWIYSENRNYEYGVIEDTRKVAFEKHIESMAKIFSIDAVSPLIDRYTSLMNIWFKDEHWKFDINIMNFIEISDSKELDSDHREHPQPDEILV